MPEQRSTSPNDGSTRPGLVKAVRLFVLVAMAVSSHLAWVSLRGGIVFGCGPDSACDRVLHSRWAYWFGVPVSLFALAAYAVILVSTFSLRPGVPVARQRQAWNWLLTCAWAVGGAALWFVGLQFLSVHAVCPYCMVAHGAGLVTAVLQIGRAHV